MMASTDPIRNTQQLASASEAFVSAIGSLFPGDTFAQFFHADTMRRAYWSALEQALERYSTPDTGPLTAALINGKIMSEPRVVAELLKLFLPGESPDYMAVAEWWAAALDLSSENYIWLALEAERLFALLSEELRQSADLRLALQQVAEARYPSEDVTPAAEEDLDRLLEAALIAGPATLSRQVRTLLALGTERDPAPPGPAAIGMIALANLADHLPPDAIQMMLERLKKLDDPALRLRILGRIVPRISMLGLSPDPLALIQEAMAHDEHPPDPILRADVLLALAPHLAAHRLDHPLPVLQQRILTAVWAIGDGASRVRALGALIHKLPPQFQPQAVALAFETALEGIPNEMARAMALSALPAHLPPEYHARLLSIAYELEAPEARALLLGRMIPHLLPDRRVQALTGALNAIEQINGDEARSEALQTLAEHIEVLGSLKHMPEGLRQAITVTFSITSETARARAFAALAPYLSPELLGEALQAIRSIPNDLDRASALVRLAPHLPPDLAVAAFAIASELQPSGARAIALAVIAPYLSVTARAQALTDALAAALVIEERYDRAVTLADLAPHLPDELQRRALVEAQTAMRSIPDDDERSRALIFLAPYLPEDRLADALADAYTIGDPRWRVPAICALLPYLPEEPRERAAAGMIDLAYSVTSDESRASILASVAPVLPDSLVGEAADAALRIRTPYERVHVLAVLLPYRPDGLSGPALASARAVPDAYERASALLELAPHMLPALRYDLLDEVLDTALRVEDEVDRASALAGLASYVDAQGDTENRQQDALALALTACLEIADPHERTMMLARLAQVWAQFLTPAQSYPLWRQVVAFLREQPYAEVVSDLAALAPVLDRLGASGTGEALASELLHLTSGGE
ncbi:MAG: hypothetical protein JW910_20540 [Anaerolineae bacterium]|nr:hypothetical protein [Anaerolineae bacterium]